MSYFEGEMIYTDNFGVILTNNQHPNELAISLVDLAINILLEGGGQKSLAVALEYVLEDFMND